MTRFNRAGEGDAPGEMLIVDTFTRLIFGDAGEWSAGEMQVIEALRTVEPDVATDDLGEMGDYLRALGVREMVELVARVRRLVETAALPVGGSPHGSGPRFTRVH